MEVIVKQTTEKKVQIEFPAYFGDKNCHVWCVFGANEYDCIQVTYSEGEYIQNTIGTGMLNCVQYGQSCTKEYFEEKFKIASNIIEAKMKLAIQNTIEA